MPKRVLMWFTFILIILLIITLWFFTTGVALKDLSKNALSPEKSAINSAKEDFSILQKQTESALEKFEKRKQLVEKSKTYSTSTNEKIIKILSQYSTSTYGSKNQKSNK